MKHYKYGGSTAARTLACPAWQTLSQAMPPQLTSSFAEVGSMLHDCMEQLLLEGGEPQDMLGFKRGEYSVSQDHVDEKLAPAMAAFKQLCARHALTEYEAETTMERTDDIGGTADFIAAGKDVVCVGDWKFGDGIAVSPDNSAQGLFYAMLARDSIPDIFEGRTRLLIAIIQPTEQGDTLKTWETDMAALDAFDKSFMRAVKRADAGDEEAGSGEHCKWCPAMPTCPAKTGLVDKMKRLNVKSIEHDKISEALEVADAIDAWVKDVRKFAHEQMELGVKFDGWKLVQKRATNKWHDEEGALALVRKAKKLTLDECAPPALLSAAQLKILCKKKGVDFDKFEAYCSATSSGTTIAKASDKRPEYIAGGAIRALRGRL